MVNKVWGHSSTAMSSSLKNVSLALSVLALMAMGTLAWRQNRQIAELRSQLATTAQAAAQRAAEVERQLASAEKRRSVLEATQSEARNRSGSERMRLNSTAISARASAALPLENPTLQRVIATGMRSSLDQRYGTLFRQLKLSLPELEKFKDLLTERQMSSLDAMTAGRTQGVSTTEIPTLVEKVQSDVDQSIHQLLGNERFDRYESFNQHMTSYSTLDQIERRLSYTNAPLDNTQSEALLQVLIDTSPAVASEEVPLRAFIGATPSFNATAPVATALGGTPLSNETITRAGTFLNPAQTAVLRQFQAEQQNQTVMMQSVRIESFNSTWTSTVEGDSFRTTPGPAPSVVPGENVVPRP